MLLDMRCKICTSFVFQILQEMAENHRYEGRETLALLLTLVGVNGLDSNCRSQVQNIVANGYSATLESVFKLIHIVDRKGNNLSLTELSVVLISAKSPIPVNVSPNK